MEESILTKLASYKPDESVIEIVKSTPIVLLVGPTGAGKDSLLHMLLPTDNYHHIVSHTTRKPRINQGVLEKDGKDYHFITLEQAESMLDNHEYIEAKIFSGNVYGTSIAEIKEARNDSKIAVTDVEVQGVAEYKAIDSNVMAIFLLPPNFTVWQERLTRRYGDVVDAEDYRLRLQTALFELEQLLNNDYYIALVNDDLSTIVDEVSQIVSIKDHKIDDSSARDVAKKLALDVKEYLDQ